MASGKRIGFFLGEEKIAVVECAKNVPLQVVSTSLGSKTDSLSPFSSTLTEEIQIIAILQKMLKDSRIPAGPFYVSLPMKEIILRSFIIPFVKPEEIHNVIRFEAKKYMPFDIQDMSFVFHTIPVAEGQSKRLQVIFFAVRKELLARYERIFKQVNAQVVLVEPYMVSLVKALLFKKEIKITDHLAFLILDKHIGRICFIDQGIPQFIREFSISPPAQSGEDAESPEDLNLRITNEVGNSFDFYARQFNGDRIEQMIVASDPAFDNLLPGLESELRVNLKKFSPVVVLGKPGAISDMETIYAMGACIVPPMEASLPNLNFFKENAPKPFMGGDLSGVFEKYKEILFVFVTCAALLIGVFVFFQSQLKSVGKKLAQLSLQEGGYLNEPIETIQAETGQNTDLLNQYKAIRSSSDVAFVVLRVASHLPLGAALSQLSVSYGQGDATTGTTMTISMSGNVYKDDPNEEIKVVNQIYSDIKTDSELLKLVKNVTVSFNFQELNGRQVTGFTINCS